MTVERVLEPEARYELLASSSGAEALRWDEMVQMCGYQRVAQLLHRDASRGPCSVTQDLSSLSVGTWQESGRFTGALATVGAANVSHCHEIQMPF